MKPKYCTVAAKGLAILGGVAIGPASAVAASLFSLWECAKALNNSTGPILKNVAISGLALLSGLPLLTTRVLYDLNEREERLSIAREINTVCQHYDRTPISAQSGPLTRHFEYDHISYLTWRTLEPRTGALTVTNPKRYGSTSYELTIAVDGGKAKTIQAVFDPKTKRYRQFEPS